jgi:hypothetical protein|tara:strand:- start:14935 stop:15366 length:432 start_codon:yes stop_codon:yes gene_type:complete
MSFDLSIKNGDIHFDSSGMVKTVVKNSKLRQDIIKIILTDIGENRFHKGYGSALGRIGVGTASGRDIVELDIRSSAEAAIKKLMALQKAQAARQYLSPGEIIVSIVKIEAGRDTVDPRMYNVFISVLTGQLTEIREVVTVRIA